MIKFALLPPPNGTDSLSDVLFVPDINFIEKTIQGNLGIAENIKSSSMLASLNSSRSEVRENPELLNQFANFFNLKLKETPEYYITRNIKNFVSSDFISLNIEDANGLVQFEKTIFQSLFETQKPFLEGILAILKVLVRVEDGIARFLALGSQSLKPIHNPKALGYKYSNLELDKLKSYSKTKDYPFEFAGQKLLDSKTEESSFEWKTISIDYSTGEKIEGVEYDYIYNNIESDSIDLNEKADKIDDDNEEQNLKPSVIVFGVYDSNGKTRSIPNYLNDKYYGSFDTNNKTNKAGINTLKRSITEQIKFQFKLKGNTASKEEIDQILNNIKLEDNIDSIINNSFLNLLQNSGSKGLNIGGDNTRDVSNFNNKGVFLGKTINYKGKDVYIDPEADYILQLVKVEGSSSVAFNNSHLSKFPMVGNYQGENTMDILEKTEYKYGIGSSARVQKVFEYHKGKKKHKDFYIIEGILADRPSKITSNTSQVYKKRHFPSAIKIFIKIIVELLTQTIPKLNDIIKLFKNPFEFITSILLDKAKNFELFNSTLLNEFTQYNIETNSINDIDDKQEVLDRKLILKKYFYLNDGKLKFIFDGVGSADLFGYSFGIGINDYKPEFLFSASGQSKMNCEDNDTGCINSSIGTGGFIDTKTGIKNITVREEETVTYSTGKYIEGVDYDYIYLTEQVEELLSKNEDLFAFLSLNDRDFEKVLIEVENETNPKVAMFKMQSLLTLLKKSPNSNIQDKMEKYRQSARLQILPIFQAPLTLLVLPIKIVICIIEYIVNFFKNLKFKTLKEDIANFLSFKWILDFFKPSKILNLCGIMFNPGLALTYLTEIQNLSEEERLVKIYDPNKIFSFPFFPNFPKYGANSFELAQKSMLNSLSGMLDFLTQTINGIIEFLWNLLNLDVILKVPKINLKGLANPKINEQQIYEVLKDADLTDPDSLNKLSEKFLYMIEFETGSLSDLTEQQVEDFVNANPNFDFKYNF